MYGIKQEDQILCCLINSLLTLAYHTFHFLLALNTEDLYSKFELWRS